MTNHIQISAGYSGKSGKSIANLGRWQRYFLICDRLGADVTQIAKGIIMAQYQKTTQIYHNLK